MTVTDIAVLILSIFFLARGASRGFMNSLTAPFSIIVATVLSAIYYQNTRDIIASLLIGLIGPLFLSLLLKFLFKTWAKPANEETKINFLSRLSGAVLTMVWGWIFIVFALILIEFSVLYVPIIAVGHPGSWEKAYEAVYLDVKKSGSYLMAERLGEYFFPALKHNTSPVTDEAANNDARSLADDPRFQAILQDPEIQKEIDAHDMVKLMGNPKMMHLVQQLMSDPSTMKKVFALYKSQSQPQSTQTP